MRHGDVETPRWIEKIRPLCLYASARNPFDGGAQHAASYYPSNRLSSSGVVTGAWQVNSSHT
jgi:hypothetical protein